MFSTEVGPHHTTAPWPSLATSAAADWVQALCADFPLPAWYNSAIPHTWTAPCRHPSCKEWTHPFYVLLAAQCPLH